MVNVLFAISLVIAAFVHIGATRASVALLARSADNAMDNAVGYLVATALLYLPVQWLWQTHLWLLIALIPLLCSVGLTLALRFIYEVSTLRAFTIWLVHAVFTLGVLTLMAVVAGFIAAYLVYGRIISDPIMLIRIVLRLIGVEPPF